jgi:hypothetical protein
MDMTLQLEIEYHGVELTRDLPKNLYRWLIEQHGAPDGKKWYVSNNHFGTTVYFANKLDHMMFLLKISS